MSTDGLTHIGRLSQYADGECHRVRAGDRTLVLIRQGDSVHVLDNRCPHMGFPLDRGSVDDGILTCHWHHARFDVCTGGTFDLWADDVPAFPTQVIDGDVWVDLRNNRDELAHHRRRLRAGLEQNLSLVIAKAAVSLVEGGADPREPFRIGLEFGTRYQSDGWGPGLTVLTCMMNLLPHLPPEQHARALYHGLTNVAEDSSGSAPKFEVGPLPDAPSDHSTLKRWFRRFVEVRDATGAERCLLTAIQADMDHAAIADMLFAAATDHRYLSAGHVLDFTNKALEALDIGGWDLADTVIGSLARGYAEAGRMEESNAWRKPIDLVEILEASFEGLPDILEADIKPSRWDDRSALIETVLGEDPQAIADALTHALRQGANPVDLADAVTQAAITRVAQFHVTNEFGDWDRALHTLSFANAVRGGLARSGSRELVRGVYDAAMSVYLDRFLNVPPARLPRANGHTSGSELLELLPNLLDRQQQVDEAGRLVVDYRATDAPVEALLASIGSSLLREDRNFHTIQAVEASIRHAQLNDDPADATLALVAGARYLAAHAPTVRSQGQTFQIAQRLQRGERLFEETPA
jgi:nitrite reductase/ring-hydroxylating ferredoxin subunit